MIKKVYKFPKTGTVVEDHGNGRMLSRYGILHEDINVMVDEAKWQGQVATSIYKDSGHKDVVILTYLNYDRPTWRYRAMYSQYKKNLDTMEFVTGLAMVGSAFHFTDMIRDFLVPATFYPKRIKFFFDDKKAKEWLGW